MKVNQVYSIVNDLTKEIIGSESVLTVAEDLSNVIEVGKAIFDVASVDNYVRKLIDHIGKVVFVNRGYTGRAPSVMFDGWEYGSVLEKIDAGISEAEANPKWSLQNGTSYDQDTFNGPKDIVVKFFNDKDTYQIPFSFAEDQVKSAFSNATQLNAFFSMIYTKIDMSITIKNDSLIMSTINNFIGNIFLQNNGKQAINLLALYKGIKPDSKVTAATAMYDMDFIKFAAYQMKMYSRRLTNASVAFNLGGRLRHTPTDLQHIVMLDAFADAADVYLQSDTFHDEFTKLPNAEKVSFWQGSGENYAWDDISAINIYPMTESGKGAQVQQTGILAVIFDRDSLGVNNANMRVTNHYNANGEFINNWYKVDARYFNDFNENFIVFYVADVATPEPDTPSGNG